ncbi:hypothetical protein CSPAE12_11907 [Colletotrichum incanum]|nr:hypothetical protein CSPAE12_11907 [Colletotrichum incanum]
MVELWEAIAAWHRPTINTIRVAVYHSALGTVLAGPFAGFRQFEKAAEPGQSTDHSAPGPQGKIKAHTFELMVSTPTLRGIPEGGKCYAR